MQTQMLEYLQIFFRRKFIFFYPFITIFFLMVILSFILPKTYQAVTVILVEEARVVNPLVSDLSLSTPMEARLLTIREQVLGWSGLSELVRRLKLDSNVKSAAAYEALINRLRKNIIVTLQGAQLVSISYAGNDAAEVFEITKNIGDIFIQQNMKNQYKEADIALNFLEDQLRYYRRKIRMDEIKRLQDELSKLRQSSTAQHPMVKDINDRIAALTLALETDSRDIGAGFTREQQAANEAALSDFMMEEIKKNDELAEPLAGVIEPLAPDDSPVTAGSTSSSDAFDANVNRIVYQRLLERLETARITQKLQVFQEGTRFTVIEPARMPLKPSKPNKTLFFIMGLMLGIAAGAGNVYLAENMDSTFHTLQQAKAGLSLPVLGTVSAIFTEDEYIRKQIRNRFSMLMFIVFFVVLLAIAAAVSLLG